MKALHRISLVCIFISGFTACPSISPVPHLSQEDCEEVVGDEREALLKQVSSRRLDSFQARLDGRISEEGQGTSFKQLVNFSRPDLLRLDILSRGLSRVSSLILFRSNTLLIIDNRERTIFRGNASGSHIERVLGVPFSPVELMDWFSGSVSIDPDAFLWVGRKGNLWCIQTDEGNKTEKFNLLMQTDNYQLLSLEILESGEPTLRSEFTYEGNRLSRVKASLPKKNREVDLTYKQIRKNIDLDLDELFWLELPSSYERKWLR